MSYTVPDQVSLSREGGYDVDVASLYDIDFPPQVFPQIYKRYGKGAYGFMDFLEMSGQTIDITNDIMKLLEEPSIRVPIELADDGSGVGIPITAAGVSIDIKLAATDYDSNGNGPLRIFDNIYVPPIYFSGATIDLQYWVKSKTGTGAATVYTLEPLNDTTEITSAVPIGEVLRKGANTHGRGTNQPEPMYNGTFERQYQTSIVKESLRFEGGQMAQKSYYDILKTEELALRNGGKGRYNKAWFETEFRLMDQINDAIFHSTLNTNPNATELDKFGNAKPVKHTKGYWNHLDDDGMKQNYSGSYNVTDFDAIKVMLESQGVYDTSVAYFMGSDLWLQVENSLLGFTKEFSQGTDLTKRMDEIGVNYKYFQKNGLTFMMKELKNFSDVQTYASNSKYHYRDAGMIIPMNKATVMKGDGNGGKFQIDSVTLGYLNNNGENRRRMVKSFSGMNGAGLPATEGWDQIQYGMMSEFMLIVAQINQAIMVRNQDLS